MAAASTTAAAAALPEPGGSFPRVHNGSPPLRASRPSWVVRTASNVRKERMKKPDPPCVVCHGVGRIECHRCRGRVTYFDRKDESYRSSYASKRGMAKVVRPLPRCMICGGSGLDYCNRCLGTGEYRDIMGFHFMKMGTNPS